MLTVPTVAAAPLPKEPFPGPIPSGGALDQSRVGAHLLVAHEFGDGDEVGAVAHELDAEGAAQHVGAEALVGVVVDAGGLAEGGDDAAGGAVG